MTDHWNRSQTHAAFLPDGGSLLTSAGIIDVQSARYRRLYSRSDTVSAASPDGGRGVVRGEVRNLESGNSIAELSGGDLLSITVFSPDGNQIAGVTTQGRLMLWDVTTGAVKWSQLVSEPGASPRPLAFSHDGRYLAYPAGNGTVHVVRLPLPGDDRAVPER